MELLLLVLLERKNIFLARQIWVRQRGAVMAFIPDLNISLFFKHFIYQEEILFQIDSEYFNTKYSFFKDIASYKFTKTCSDNGELPVCVFSECVKRLDDPEPDVTYHRLRDY